MTGFVLPCLPIVAAKSSFGLTKRIASDTSRDENEREWAGNYLSHLCYNIFFTENGSGSGKVVAKTVAEYMGIRKRTHTNEYSTKTDGSRIAAGCTHHTGALQLSAIFFCSDMSHAMTMT
jgi:hypothetical protein